MKTLQVRHVPEDVHRSLHIRAAQAGVSLSDYVLGELTRIASRPTLEQTLEQAGARSGGARATAVVAAVRDGRERSEP